MKLLRKATYAIVLAVVFSFTFQCSSSKDVATTVMFEDPSSFQVKSVYFQEWYAGIKVGGTGINVFVPIVNKDSNITIDRIYFRNLTGKLVKEKERYLAVLKNDSPHYTFTKSEQSSDFPFTLTDKECAISYLENGQTKYMKITEMEEVAGTYYENGPPSIYDNSSSDVVANRDKDKK